MRGYRIREVRYGSPMTQCGRSMSILKPLGWWCALHAEWVVDAGSRTEFCVRGSFTVFVAESGCCTVSSKDPMAM